MGSMGKGDKGPRGPDPQQLIQQQAQANRVDQFSPFGSFQFSGPNRNRLDISLAPAQQRLLEQQIGLGQALGQRAQQFATGDPFRGQPEIEPLDRQRIEQSIFDRQRGLLDPVFEQQERDLRQSLANRGQPVGGEAFGTELGNFQQERNQAFERAAQQAVQFGGQEQSRQLADQLRARQQGIQEQFLPMQGLQAGISGIPLRLPQMQQTQPVDIMGPHSLRTQALMGRAQIGQQQRSSMLGGLTQLGGALGAAAIMASDRRVKEAIQALGRVGQLMLYTFRYIGDKTPQIGFMADEVAEVIPSAVHTIDGIQHVDYRTALYGA